MPWCHNCGSEFAGDVEKCPDCGCALKESEPPTKAPKMSWSFKRNTETSAEWPKDSNGNSVPAALLTNIGGSQIDYDLALSVLRSFNIPYTCDFPGGGRLAKIYLGFSGGGMDIYVPETMLEDARNILSYDTEESK